MAIRDEITAVDEWFPGEDKQLSFAIYDEDDVTPIDVAAWTFEWSLYADQTRQIRHVQKTTTGGGISITGTFDPSPILNTQRVIVTTLAADTTALRPKTYWHRLQRVDGGTVTTLSHGPVVLD